MQPQGVIILSYISNYKVFRYFFKHRKNTNGKQKTWSECDIGTCRISLQTLQLQINPNVLIDSSIQFDTINFGWSIVYIEGSQVIIAK